MAKKNLICIFLISVLTLALQLLETRILSVLYWHHLVYFVVTLGLLGMAAGGTALSVSKKLKEMDGPDLFRLCLAGFSISELSGMLIVGGLSSANDFFASSQSFFTLFGLATSYVLIMIPYFFFGLLISGEFFRHPGQSGQIYLFNLTGSAAGCLLYVLLIRPLGAELFLVLIFAAGLLPVILTAPGWGLPSRAAVAVILLAVSWTGYHGLRFLPERNKQYWTLFENSAVEFSEWNAISRIDVLSNRDRDEGYKRILIDGDAQTPMLHVDLAALTPDSLLYVPRDFVYLLNRRRIPEKALIIGSGGGSDVLAAYKYGAKEIDAAEINPSIVKLVTGYYSSYIGGVFKQKNVNLHLEDGRSFVRRTGKKYDAIVLFGVDSLAALSSGAYILMESYLYTLQAFSDYWSKLDEDGIIQISRWFYRDVPRETLRAFITAYRMLLLNGVKDPSAHLLVLSDSALWQRDQPFGYLFISKRPFELEQLRRLGDWLQARRLTFDLIYSPFSLKEEHAPSSPFDQFARAAAEGREESFYRDYPFNVKPVTDDDPFFFQYGRWSHAFKPYPDRPGYFDSIQGRWPFLVLLMLVFQTVVLTAFLVGWPCWKLSRKTGNFRTHIPILAYFSLLGIGFMFVEMFFIQKCVLFLGHPIYSMAVTIPALLAGAGLGSFALKRKWNNAGAWLVILGAWSLASWIIAMRPETAQFLLQHAIPLRIAAVCALIFPVGALLGMPFPFAIKKLIGFTEIIPIAWAVNGGMSVVSSVLAVVLAMTFGFQSLVLSALAAYFLAFVFFRIWVRRTAIKT